MKRIRIIGLCLFVAAAVGGIASASASAAEPVFLTKTVVKEGVSIPLSATLGAAFLEGENKSKITCVGGTGTAEITGPKTSKAAITTFTGCETQGFKCNSTGQAEGVIVTFPLEGHLGAISATLPGERLWREGAKGGELATFSCAGGAIAVKVKGSLIGSLSGAAGTDEKTGKLLASGKLSFAEAAGKQKYCKFIEGETQCEQLEASVSGQPFEKSGQSVIATLKTIPATWGLGVTK